VLLVANFHGVNIFRSKSKFSNHARKNLKILCANISPKTKMYRRVGSELYMQECSEDI
jgi:hypothetical protein